MPYPKSSDPLAPGSAAAAQSGAAFGVTPNPVFPDIERAVLAFWEADDTFQESIRQREGAPEWVFYDGPPFANGLPHYGHLLTGYAKDLFPRYQTMRGKQVHRRFGWDTHGLPAELEAMKQLGITEKSEIEAMGIGEFNAAARESVLTYTKEWEQYVTRQARWVDFENGYKTLDIGYMESVMWAFKQLYDKGLAYEGYRVLPYCWQDQTPLSNHELRMDDDVYASRQDQSVVAIFPLQGERAEQLGLAGVAALAWTTTPWTLPTNAALAVGPGIHYAVVETADRSARYLIATELIGKYAKQLGYPDAQSAQAGVTRHLLGAELAGVRYAPLWDYYTDVETYGTQHAWQILVAEYVTASDGTGIVHQAPAYGEDDQVTCEAAGIPVILSVDEGGRFTNTVPPLTGLHAFEANKPIIQQLKVQGRLFHQASFEHPYPHCWRCRQPLMYKAVSSWFVRVTEFRDRLVELNQHINWVPENVKDGQFGKWLAGARDWSISRNRYWGSPIPVWKSDNPEYPRVDVYGSLDEIERDFGVRPDDLHRPHIDQLTRPNPDDPSGASTMRRIEDVLDVWFDSGSMPFAQNHVPFQHADWFDAHAPADFIVEYIGQTRGWFYMLHILSVALFDRPAFRNVISHGIVLGSDGQKMSKSLRNYPDVNEVFDRDGSDAMRWFLMASPVLRGGNLIVTEQAIREGVRQVLLPLWNTWYFLSLYANADGYEANWSTASPDQLDRYILAKLGTLVTEVTGDLDRFDATVAAAKLRDFAEVLTNWYVRRSRDRFWQGTATDPQNAHAFNTLYTVLETLCRLSAPFLPLISEHIWRGLTGERSVHLTDWPNAADFPADDELVAVMDAVRQVTSSALSLRKANGIRVRQPLSRLTVVVPESAPESTGAQSATLVGPEALRPFATIIAEELNVKRVELVLQAADTAASFGIEHQLTVHAKIAGPRLGGQVQHAIRAAKSGDWQQTEAGVIAGGIALEPQEYSLTLAIAETAGEQTRAVTLLPGGGCLVLDTALTAELRAEGLARDVIRAVQDARKAAGLDVSDRISLLLQSDRAGVDAMSAHRELIAAETLAVQLELQQLPAESADETLQVGEGSPLSVQVSAQSTTPAEAGEEQ